MECRRIQKFSRELKRLSKRYRSLGADVSKLERVLEKLPCGTGGRHWNRLYASSDGSILIYKVRLACVSLRGQSLLRVIYACRLENGSVTCIDLIELYYKGEKESEDQERIDDYLVGDLD